MGLKWRVSREIFFSREAKFLFIMLFMIRKKRLLDMFLILSPLRSHCFHRLWGGTYLWVVKGHSTAVCSGLVKRTQQWRLICLHFRVLNNWRIKFFLSNKNREWVNKFRDLYNMHISITFVVAVRLPLSPIVWELRRELKERVICCSGLVISNF